MSTCETARALLSVLSILREEGREMPLEPLMREFAKALDEDAAARPATRPVIVMFANNVNFDCQSVSYRGTGSAEPADINPAEDI